MSSKIDNIEEILKNSKQLNIEVTDELKQSFISYAMAVNVSRAIPDVRDGLKPVHRRILYAMHELGNTHDKPHKKSARIVGEVLGKYHPHGDTAVYDALVRMAQPFSIRNILIDGHGNFGSIDGDSPAAMRYTEARMSKLAAEMLRDIDKETVDKYPNFDDTLLQPTVLPSRYPNVLVNGAEGIAVAMATSIPPHNLNEVIDGTIALIDNPEITIHEIMEYIKAPDYPTGGIILGLEGIRKAYMTGSGSAIIRSHVEIEKFNKGTRDRIVVKEIPYQVNKEVLIKQIHDLASHGKLDGISQINEESDREGMRIVIDVKKGTDPQYVLNQLFKHTRMQISNSIKLLALVKGKPTVLNIKEMLESYIEHQIEIITRRTQYDLNKALEKEHILKGLVIALANIDEVIKIIKTSRDNKDAQDKLADKFELSERQSTAILEMKLKRLTSLEVEKINEELNKLEKDIEYFRSILADKNIVNQIIKDELIDIKNKFTEPRRSVIEENYEEIDNEDLIEREDIVVTVSHEGYVKSMSVDDYKAQGRGGVGTISQKTKDDDFTENIFLCNTHDYLLFFTTKGKVYRKKAYTIPRANNKTSKGRAIINIIPTIDNDEKVKAITPVNEENAKYVLIITKKGKIKKTPIQEYSNINKIGKKAIVLLDGDEVVNAHLTSGNNEIMIATSNGRIIRYHEDCVRPQGRSSMGCTAIKLSGENDCIVDTLIVDDRELFVTVTEKGKGKINTVDSVRKTLNKSGKGVLAGKMNENTGKLVAIKLTDGTEDAIIVTNLGVTIRFSLEDIGVKGRNTQGVIFKKCKENEVITSLTLIPKEDKDSNEESEENKIKENNEESSSDSK